ncbi:unnamed protein product [Ceratitis capitata]|uniref:(Mediterranean fruit fly) hypothetical protein n=1 Tax=Ceratitis capitata TaxID=7213 RepID=A0A811VG79_CERCA|nr:unnamed protein product [Ceratitis capitata]
MASLHQQRNATTRRPGVRCGFVQRIGENRKPEYLAINPHGTVPTLTDDDDVLTDSHAIITYLVDKYGVDDSLYPKDLIQRAKVNQILFYEATMVFDRTFLPISKAVFNNHNVIPVAKIDAVYSVYERLESFLQEHPFVAGENLTVADFSLIVTISSLFTYAELVESKYPKLLIGLDVWSSCPIMLRVMMLA